MPRCPRIPNSRLLPTPTRFSKQNSYQPSAGGTYGRLRFVIAGLDGDGAAYKQPPTRLLDAICAPSMRDKGSQPSVITEEPKNVIYMPLAAILITHRFAGLILEIVFDWFYKITPNYTEGMINFIVLFILL